MSNSKLALMKRSTLAAAGMMRMGIFKSLAKKGLIKKKLFDDTIVVSYPKSGRTWLRVMFDYLNIHLKYDHFLITADRKNFNYENRTIVGDTFASKKIIFLIRDPRDVVVSSYFQSSKREQVYQGSIADYIRCPEFGIHRILDYQITWLANKAVSKDFFVVRYEDLMQDTVASLEKIVEFLGIKKISRRKLNRTIELFHFENMHHFEKIGLLGARYGNRLRPLGDKSQDAFKVRRGVVGGYKDYLSPNDIDYCNQQMAKAGLELYR